MDATEQGLTPAEREELTRALAAPTLRRVGPYTVVRELGRGGMGVVLLAWDPRLERLVAIKRLLEEASGPGLQRFQREARLAAGLRHPGIAQVHEVVLTGPQAPYMVQEYVRGEPLSTLARGGRLGARRAAELVLSACEGVSAAHAAGVVHRDLKPHNVLVTPQGRAVVLDFGIARGEQAAQLTRTGVMIGTPAYAAPELLEDAREAGPPADVYGLGATLYECLSGVPPFQGSPRSVITAVLTRPPTPLRELVADVPAALAEICERCLAKEPEERYPEAAALAAALAEYLRAEAGAKDAAPTPPRPPRRGLALLLAALLVAVGALALLLLLAPGTRGRAEAALARLEQGLRFQGLPRQQDPLEETRLISAGLAEADAALRELDAALVVAPDDPGLLLTRARALRALWRTDEALEAAARARALDPQPGAACLLEAELRLERRVWELFDPPLARDASPAELEEVRGLLARAEELGAPAPPLTRAWLAILGGDAAGARSWLEQASQADPDRLAFARAWARWWTSSRAERRNDALGALLEEAAVRPARQPLVLRQRVLWLLERADFAQALAEAERALLLVADAPRARAHLTLLRARAREGTRDAAGAAADYRAALELHPGWPRPWPLYYLGSLELQGGALPAALEHAERALELAPDWPLGLTLRANLKLHQGREREALADLDRALVLDPELALAYRDRAFTRQRLGQPEGLADLERSLALDPDDPEARYRRAMRRMEGKDAQGALEDALRACELAPRTSEYRLYLAYLRRHMDDLAGSRAELDRVIELAPGNARAWADRGLVRRQQGDLRGALADYDRALQLDPSKAETWMRRAIAREHAGDLRGALADVEEVLKRDPQHRQAQGLRRTLEPRLRRPRR